MYTPSTDDTEQTKTLIQAMSQTSISVIQGYITSVDSSTSPYSVKVMLEPFDYESGWLPLQTPYAGPDCGIIIPPPDEMTPVIVVCELGHPSAGKVIAMQWNDDATDPGLPVGTFGLLHKSGQRLLLNPDGSVSLTTKAGYGLTISNNGQVTIKGTTTTQTW